MKKTSFMMSLLLTVGMLPSAVGAQGPTLAPGQLVKAKSSSAVYYIDEDLGRQVFPNGRIFASWYANFDGVVTVDDATLSEYPLTGNVPSKPAKRLVKIQTDPKVYAVDEGGVLRWVKSEAAARALYGDRWNQLVDDLSDAFFVDYAFGDDIEDDGEFDTENERRGTELLKTLREKRLHRLKEHGASSDDLENDGFGKNKVAVCHKSGSDDAHTIFIARPALPAHLGHGDKEGRCGGDGNVDTTAPTFVSASIGSVTMTSAHVLFTASESVTASVYVSTSTPVVASGTATVSVTTSATSHDITLTGLASGTSYRVVIVASDAAGNKRTSSELTFTTQSPDVVAPTFLTATIGSATTTSAHVLFTTDENATALIYSSTSTPVDTSASATAAASATTLATSHDVLLSGLLPATTYHVRIVVSDAAGNKRTSAELTFTTPSGS